MKGFRNVVRKFLLPTLNRRYLLRVVIVTAAAFLFFRYVLRPVHVQGGSMEPTYHDGSFNFCVCVRYIFSEPKRGDVVTVKFAGTELMLLKRVVAVSGDTVAFDNGMLVINGQPQKEPYVKYRSADWNLSPRTVLPGHVYVVGDNRSMEQSSHRFGQTALSRIAGTPLW
jgi:signal peptidase I